MEVFMRFNKKLCKLFTTDEYGYPMIPVKYSNTMISRYWNQGYVCTWDFPHHNSGIYAPRSSKKCWKMYRKHQWRD
jgi:hypothetical protein